MSLLIAHATRATRLLLACLASAFVGCGGGGENAQPNSTPTNTVVVAANGGAIGGASNTPGAAATLGSCAAFPSDAAFNTRVDSLPVHAQSSTWITSIGTNVAFHGDWGRNEDQADWSNYFGIPINTIDGASLLDTNWPTVNFSITDPRAGNGDGVPEESDCASIVQGTAQRPCSAVAAASRQFPYPQPTRLKAEYGACNDAQQCGDRHVLVVDQRTCTLWESYYSYQVSGQWFAYSTAAWGLNELTLRPDTWTSGDAAGLPIAPLIARVGEASAGEMNHALRVTFQEGLLDRSYQWPARHAAGGATPGGIPFGAVLRLQSSFTIPTHWTTQSKAIARAMQRYGLYVADIGSNFFVQGEPSALWDPVTQGQLSNIRLQNMEFVDITPWQSRPGWNGNSLRVQ